MMRRLLILPIVAAVLLTTAAPAALAADGAVVHRESVLTELDASGAPGTSRVFTQMTVPKGEKVTLSGQSTASLRTLSGAMSRDGGDLVFGGGLSRTVADHTADLPVEVEVTYSIDGTTVDAGDVVGHDGEVAVTYVVRNLTTQATEVTMIDGDRVASKETVDVAVPLVGSLRMTLPPAFTNVVAPGAVVVGDGRGNTVVNWSLLLFSPLGSETQEVTWTAAARDAVVPEANLQVIPVSPASFGSFDSTADAYQGAVGSTRELTAGARQIDRNLTLLATGAGKLLAGLTQLRDGSAELAAGLGDARDGAADLSAGLGSARAGAGELSSGLGQLATGSSDLAAGASDLAAGAALLEEGLESLEAALLTPGEGIDKLKAGIPRLQGGLSNPLCAIGDPGNTTNPCGITQLNDRVLELNGSVTAGLAGAFGALDAIEDSTVAAMPPADQQRLATAAGTIAAIQPAAGGITLYAGGTTTVVGKLQLGLSNPACDKTDPTNPANPCGLLEGLEILEAGVAGGLGSATTPDTLLNGAARVAAGAAAVAAGAEELASGTAKADAGAAELAAGTGQLDDGGDQLADGLVDAADGSQQIADGLATATPGGQQIADGTQRLTDEGTSVLARSVSDASASSSLQLAHVRAVAARGTEGDGLPYPTVDGAMASAVYEFNLAGVGADTGPGTAGRIGLGALALLAAALLGSLAGGRTGRRDEIAASVEELAEV